MKCRHCTNGYIDPDPPSSRRYACEDCDGTGEVEYCERCGMLTPYYGVGPLELCSECQDELEREDDDDETE